MMKSISALKLAASVVALSLAPIAANAAECFDKNTDDPKAGNATAVVGPDVDVRRQNVDGIFRPASGADMFTGDTVRTGEASHMQLKLCDWSTYTFSPNSESAINEFFDSRGAGRRRVVNFFRGGFRFASGRDTKPGETEVEIQDSGVTMGVRGTNVILAEIDDCVYALLEGPVRDNNGLTPRGLVEFWTEENRDAIAASLKRPGWAVCINDAGVSEPFRADDALLRRIYQAFVPVVPEGDGFTIEYAGNPLDDSGQGAQEAEEFRDLAEKRGEESDEQTEQKPEEPFEEGGGTQIPVGDIFPLDVLETFAATQEGTQPDGYIFALAPAQVFTDAGTGPTLQDEGVALIQIHVDWVNRIIAPEALASFVKLDFSVVNPADLTISDYDFFVPDEVEDAYLQAVLNTAGLNFAAGTNNLAVFPGQLFTFTLRQGMGATATADVDVDISATSDQNVIYNAIASAQFLEFLPGEGSLAFFNHDLGSIATPSGLASFQSSGTSLLSGASDTVVNTLTGSLVPGVSYGQLEIDFDNQTVGGANSFFVINGDGVGAQLVSLDQPVAFNSGLFGLTLFPLNTLSNDPNVLKGQALVSMPDGLGGDIAGILSDSSGDHLWAETELLETFRQDTALASISGLEAQAGVLPGVGYYYGGMGYAQLLTAAGDYGYGSATGVFDIDFANRTVGGAGSFVSVDISFLVGPNFTFSEAVSAISFDDALNSQGVFALGSGDFSGSTIDAGLLLIRSGSPTGDGNSADFYFDFSDGAGGDGFGVIENMPLTEVIP